MTSVGDTANPLQPTRAPKRPKCSTCRGPVKVTPGKVTPTYCSDACRKRAKRILAKAPSDAKVSGVETPNVAGQAAFSGPKTGVRFSTTARKVSTPGQRGYREEITSKRTFSGNGGSGGGWEARFERREAHQTVALGKRFCGCGARLTGGAAGVMVGAVVASFAGVQTCGSVHMCPVCGTKVLAVRAEDAQMAADALAAAGYGVYLGSHVLRHFKRQRYGSLRRGERGGLVAVLHDAWSLGFAKAGRPWRRLVKEFGIVGYERAFEDTWGSETGFHLHFHVLYVTEHPLSQEEFRAFRRRLAATWRDAVLAAGGYEVSTSCDKPGCPCEGEGHGTDLRPLGKGEEGDAARYLYKDGDKGTAGFGMEFTRSDLKSGRTWGRMSPWQLGDLAAEELEELGGPGPLTVAFREREHGVHGVKKHRRTPGLNKVLRQLEVAQDERTDEEIAAAEENQDRRLVAVIPSDTWYGHVVRLRGRRQALLRAAEALGEVGVRTLIESWGLVWGTDVLPAETA